MQSLLLFLCQLPIFLGGWGWWLRHWLINSGLYCINSDRLFLHFKNMGHNFSRNTDIFQPDPFLLTGNCLLLLLLLLSLLLSLQIVHYSHWSTITLNNVWSHDFVKTVAYSYWMFRVINLYLILNFFMHLLSFKYFIINFIGPYFIKLKFRLTW